MGIEEELDDDTLLLVRGYSLGVSASPSWAWSARSNLEDERVKSFTVETSPQLT